jgi:hypothetical protein
VKFFNLSLCGEASSVGASIGQWNNWVYCLRAGLFSIIFSVNSFGSDWRCLALIKNPINSSFIASCYDKDSIVWNDNIVRYWTKSVSFELLAELPSSDPEASKYIAESAIKSINAGYIPTIMKTKSINSSIPSSLTDKFIFYTTMIEKLANLERTKISDKSCFEVNVNEQLYRLVSIIEFDSHGIPITRNGSGKWESIHPDSQIASVLELLKIIKQ